MISSFSEASSCLFFCFSTISWGAFERNSSSESLFSVLSRSFSSSLATFSSLVISSSMSMTPARGKNISAPVSYTHLDVYKRQGLRGCSPDAVGRELGVHPYAGKKALAQSANWTFPEIENAIFLLCGVDEAIKLGKTDPVSAMDYVLAELMKRQK